MTTSLRCSCKRVADLSLSLHPSPSSLEGSPLCPTPYIHSELKQIVYAVHDMFFSLGIFCSLYYYAVLYWHMDPHQSHDGLFPMHEESLSRESNWFLNSMCSAYPIPFPFQTLLCKSMHKLDCWYSAKYSPSAGL